MIGIKPEEVRTKAYFSKDQTLGENKEPHSHKYLQALLQSKSQKNQTRGIICRKKGLMNRKDLLKFKTSSIKKILEKGNTLAFEF